MFGYIRNILLVIVTIVLFNGCVTQNACYNKYPPKSITKDSIIYRPIFVPIHDTAYIKIKADTVHDSVPVFIHNGVANSKPITKENEFAKAIAQVRDGKCFLDLMKKDTSIKIMFQDSVKAYVKDHYHSEVIIPKPQIIYKTHLYDKAARSIAGGVLIIFGVWLGIKIIPKLFI